MQKEFLTEFYAFLEKYEQFYSDFLMLESEKYVVISKNEYKSLDAFIKKEQVYLLKSKGFELERDNYMKKFGSRNLTLKQCIDRMQDSADRDRFAGLHKRLSDILSDLKEANRLSNYLIGLHLHMLDSNIKKVDSHTGSEKLYTSSARECGQSFNSISKKV